MPPVPHYCTSGQYASLQDHCRCPRHVQDHQINRLQLQKSLERQNQTTFRFIIVYKTSVSCTKHTLESQQKPRRQFLPEASTGGPCTARLQASCPSRSRCPPSAAAKWPPAPLALSEPGSGLASRGRECSLGLPQPHHHQLLDHACSGSNHSLRASRIGPRQRGVPVLFSQDAVLSGCCSRPRRVPPAPSPLPLRCTQSSPSWWLGKTL